MKIKEKLKKVFRREQTEPQAPDRRAQPAGRGYRKFPINTGRSLRPGPTQQHAPSVDITSRGRGHRRTNFTVRKNVVRTARGKGVVADKQEEE